MHMDENPSYWKLTDEEENYQEEAEEEYTAEEQQEEEQEEMTQEEAYEWECTMISSFYEAPRRTYTAMFRSER